MAGRLLKVVYFWLHAKKATDVDSTPNIHLKLYGFRRPTHVRDLHKLALYNCPDCPFPLSLAVMIYLMKWWN